MGIGCIGVRIIVGDVNGGYFSGGDLEFIDAASVAMNGVNIG